MITWDWHTYSWCSYAACGPGRALLWYHKYTAASNHPRLVPRDTSPPALQHTTQTLYLAKLNPNILQYKLLNVLDGVSYVTLMNRLNKTKSTSNLLLMHSVLPKEPYIPFYHQMSDELDLLSKVNIHHTDYFVLDVSNLVTYFSIKSIFNFGYSYDLKYSWKPTFAFILSQTNTTLLP